MWTRHRHCARPYRRIVDDQPDTPARGLLRLVVASPDGTRVLGRPNGLAGWALPAIPVTLPFATWGPDDLARAAATLGSTVAPLTRVVDEAWAVRVERIGAAGNTWIGEDEVDRLGSDAPVARAWFRSARESGTED